MRVILLTRTDRPSGARVAQELIKSRHELVAIIAEPRESLFQKKGGLLSVIISSAKELGVQFVFAKAWEHLLIKLNYLLRICHFKRCDSGYHSIAEFLLDNKIPYYLVPNHNSDETENLIRNLKPDVLILANTRIISGKIIKIPGRGCVNLHLGKLPEYRGLASCFWELYNGEKKGGITVHFVKETLDSGDILLEDFVEITKNDDESKLYEKKAARGAEMIREALDLIESGRIECKKQDPSKAKMYHWPTLEERKKLKHKLLAAC